MFPTCDQALNYAPPIARTCQRDSVSEYSCNVRLVVLNNRKSDDATSYFEILSTDTEFEIVGFVIIRFWHNLEYMLFASKQKSKIKEE